MPEVNHFGYTYISQENYMDGTLVIEFAQDIPPLQAAAEHLSELQLKYAMDSGYVPNTTPSPDWLFKL